MSRERNESSSSDQHCYRIKLRGLPQSTTKDDITRFLSPCAITDIHLFNSEGHLSNECMIDLESETDMEDALKLSGQCLNNKEIQIYPATIHEYNFFMKHNGAVSWNEPVIRMSGLPFGCTMGDVQMFFDGIEIALNGIYITRDMADKALGGGFVAFVTMDNAFKAIDTHDQKHIQHRYIELFPSSYEEAKQIILNDARSNAKQFAGETEDNDEEDHNVTNNDKSNHRSQTRSRSRSRTRSRSRRRSRSTSRDHRRRDVKRRHSPSVSPSPRTRPPAKRTNQRPYDRYRRRSRSRSPIRRSPVSSNRSDEYLVKMRGMPYTVVEDDIRKFFGSSCQPRRIDILQDRRMHRPNGDAYVYFNTIDEANEAMKYDRKYMGSRYIELYFDSPRNTVSNHRHRKTNGSPRRSSPSPPKSRSNHYRRSRSDSDD